jgi:2-polyprenyl-3-methyl-5-hydroxy-6-metoxy-1,4-benzoquinol methylase
METVACNLCGSVRQERLWEGQDWAYGHAGTFTVVRCVECGLIFLNPRPTPDEISSYYPRDYEPYRRTARALRSPLRDLIHRLKLRPRVRVVTHWMDSGRLLDVGCGSGGFLREMHRLGGWQVQGIEIDPEMVRFAQAELGMDVLENTLEEAGFPDHAFDIITMWDVLEHMHDPLAVLREVRRILRPGGLVICSTPNVASLDAKIFGRYWIGFDVPRHLYTFSPSTLAALLRKAALDVERVFCFYGRYTTFALSLSLWLNARIRSPRWRRRVSSSLHFFLFRYLTLPYFLVLDALHRGAIMTVVARRAAENASLRPE